MATLAEKAHAAVASAIARGELKPQACEVGTDCRGSVVAHHDDYAQPLAVRWLCHRHHRLVHTGAKQPPLMFRANINPDEWRAIRAIALERNTTAAELVAASLRQTYNLNGEPSK